MHLMVLSLEVQGLGWEVVDHCRVKASSKDLLILTHFFKSMGLLGTYQVCILLLYSHT